MISLWHLLWIIPISVIFGFSVSAFLCAAKEADRFIETNRFIKIESKEDEPK